MQPCAISSEGMRGSHLMWRSSSCVILQLHCEAHFLKMMKPRPRTSGPCLEIEPSPLNSAFSAGSQSRDPGSVYRRARGWHPAVCVLTKLVTSHPWPSHITKHIQSNLRHLHSHPNASSETQIRILAEEWRYRKER